MEQIDDLQWFLVRATWLKINQCLEAYSFAVPDRIGSPALFLD